MASQQLPQQSPLPSHHPLQPITAGGGDDKKKEAQGFIRFYFKIRGGMEKERREGGVRGLEGWEGTVRRSTVLALYEKKVQLDLRYKSPNAMANLCGVLYGIIYSSLSEVS